MHRGWLGTGLAAVAVVCVLVAGTAVEANWLGCERALDSDTQRGTASAHLAVHSVGCTYEGSYLRPAATEHHFPVGGVVLVTMAALLVLAGVAFVLGVNAYVRRRMRAMADAQSTGPPPPRTQTTGAAR